MIRGQLLLNLVLLLSLNSERVRAGDEESRMLFRYDRDTIYATGSIDVDAAARLSQLVKSERIAPGTVVAFSSPGGNVVGSMRLGQAIRDLKLNTNVFRKGKELTAHFRGEDGLDHTSAVKLRVPKAADCASACTYAYLGGVQRHLSFESRLGIHQFHFPASAPSGGAEDAQLLSASIVAYLAAMGAEPTLFSASALFKTDQLRFLTRHEAEDFGLVNNGVIRSVVRYQVNETQAYPEMIQESDGGTFKLGLLCKGEALFVIASRQLNERKGLLDDSKGGELFFWMDDQPVFRMDGAKDQFYQSLNSASLAKLFASRRIRLWVLKEGFGFYGDEMHIDDWSHFRDYASECGRG